MTGLQQDAQNTHAERGGEETEEAYTCTNTYTEKHIHIHTYTYTYTEKVRQTV